MKQKIYYLPHLNLYQKITKKSYALFKKTYDNLFATKIAMRDVMSIEPHRTHYSTKDTAILLFRQSLRDDFAHSDRELYQKVKKNPYMPNILLLYNHKEQKIYKYAYNSDTCHVDSVQNMKKKLLSNGNYLHFCRKVAIDLNYKLDKLGLND